MRCGLHSDGGKGRKAKVQNAGGESTRRMAHLHMCKEENVGGGRAAASNIHADTSGRHL